MSYDSSELDTYFGTGPQAFSERFVPDFPDRLKEPLRHFRNVLFLKRPSAIAQLRQAKRVIVHGIATLTARSGLTKKLGTIRSLVNLHG